MLLNTITSRWPRAFSAIGVGAIEAYAGFTLYIDGRNDGMLSVDPKTTPLDANQQIYLMLLELSSQTAIVVGLILIFVFYVIGEATILLGGIVIYGFASDDASKRAAKIAFLENPTLNESFHRKLTQSELLIGVGLATFFLFVARLIAVVVSDSTQYGLDDAFIFLIPAVVLTGLGHLVLREIDSEIRRFEELVDLRHDPAKHENEKDSTSRKDPSRDG